MKRFGGRVSQGAIERFLAQHAALERRNMEIAQKASHSERSYVELGRAYNLTRERIRQIVKLYEPAEYKKRREAWKKRKKIVDYGPCPKCGEAKSRPNRRLKLQYRLVDPEGRCCMACRKKLYNRKITLHCRCGRENVMPMGRLLFFQNRGEYKRVRLRAGGKRAIYVCQPCWSKRAKRVERAETPKITLVCRCGTKREISLRALLCLKDRGEYVSARLAADGKTGTFVCLLCYRATRKSARARSRSYSGR